MAKVLKKFLALVLVLAVVMSMTGMTAFAMDDDETIVETEATVVIDADEGEENDEAPVEEETPVEDEAPAEEAAPVEEEAPAEEEAILDTQSEEDEAEEVTYVAQIGEVKYETLQAAITAVYNTDTKTAAVTLLADETIANDVNGLKIWKDCDITLDMNGKTIWGAIWNYGILTITGNGTVSNTKNENTWPAVENRGTLTVENGTYIAKPVNYALGNYGGTDVTINGGTFQGVINNGGTMTIEGGTFNACYNGASINGLMNWSGTVTINGGVFYSDKDCPIQPIHTLDELIVNDGTVTALQKGVPFISMQDYEGSQASVTITGGKFSANTGSENAEVETGILHNYSAAQPQISGGTFSHDVSKYCVGAYQVTGNGDGTWTVTVDPETAVAQIEGGLAYTTLQKAIGAAEDGDTVKLLKSKNESVTIAVEKNITLNLNGCTLANVKFNVTNTGNLKVDGKGTIKIGGGTAVTVNGGAFTLGENATLSALSGSGVVLLALEGESARADVYGTVSVFGYGISGNAGANYKGQCFINVYEGAKVTSGGNAAMYLPNGNDTTNISGGTIEGVTGVSIRGGTLNVSGAANIEGTGTYNMGSGNVHYGFAYETIADRLGNGNCVYGPGIVAIPHSTKDAIEVNISGGTVKGFYALAQHSANDSWDGPVTWNVTGGTFTANTDTYAPDTSDNRGGPEGKATAVHIPNETKFISGGTFSDDVTEYCVEGYKAVLGEGDLYHVVEKVYVAQVGNTKYETLQSAINAAEDGATVFLLADVDTAAFINVNKSITINGGNHKVNSTASRILRVTVDNVTVTLNDIEFVSAKAERGVQVDPDMTGVELNINGCTVPGTYYAVNICGNTSVALNINDSTIRSWGALNLWGSNHEVKVTNSTLIGHNDKGYSEAGWNGFGVIVLEGNTDEHASNCHVVLDDCHIIASTAVNADGNANIQKVILFNNPSTNNTVEITGDNTVVEYTQGELTPFCVQNGSENTIAISGGIFSSEVELSHCAEGYLPVANADGTYGVVKHTPEITADPDKITGAGTVTLTVNVPSNLSAEIEVTGKNVETEETITVTPAGDRTYTVSLPNATATYVFRVDIGDLFTGEGVTPPSCVVTADRYTAPVTPVTPSEPDETDEPTVEIDDEGTALADRPFLFEDVLEDDWFYGDVKNIFENGLINGTTTTTYEPQTELSRGMIVTILWRIAGEPTVETTSTFADVPENAYYFDAINWGAENNIARGYDEETFAPDKLVSREELAAFIYRYAELIELDLTEIDEDAFAEFGDADSVQEFAITAMKWAVSAGIIKGDDGMLNPQNSATRAEAAAMINRFIQLPEVAAVMAANAETEGETEAE